MHSIRKPGKIISTGMCLLLFSVISYGQVYQFLNYGSNRNIPSSFVYTLNQDYSGYLWTGTGAGISKFDGFDFYNVPYPDSSGSRLPTTSITDSKGTIWFGCDDGSVFYVDRNSLIRVPSTGSRTISSIIQGPDGLIYIIPQGGSVYRVNPDKPGETESFGIDPGLNLFSACFTSSGELMLGTRENIQVCRISEGVLSVVSRIEGFEYANITAIHRFKDTGRFLVGTNGNGLFILGYAEGKIRLEKLNSNPDLEYLSVQSITEDSESNLWISTNDSGIFMISFPDEENATEVVTIIDKDSGLPGNNIRKVFQDMEGNYWIALFGDGISMLASYAFSFCAPGIEPGSNNIIYINKHGDDYFLGSAIGYQLYDIQNNRLKAFVDLRRRTGNSGIASYFVDKEENVWIGTTGAGLYLRNSSGQVIQYYRSADSGENYITDIAVDENYVWLGTRNGVLLLNKRTGGFMGRYNINNGLPHNYINRLLLNGDGSVVVGLKSEKLYRIDPASGTQSWSSVMSGSTLNEITSLASGPGTSIWTSTAGNGIFEFRGDSVRQFSRSEMLMSDYGYSILVESGQRVWTGHEGGFSRFNLETGVMRTFSSDFARGGKCNPAGMYESPDGKVLIGLTEGLIIYDRMKDIREKTPPQSNINQIIINDRIYPYQESFVLPYSKKYDIQIDYVGIQFNNPEKVYYQTILENWDDDWSGLKTERTKEYSLSSGHYKFSMTSFSEDGLTQQEPVSFEIMIKQPFWRTWWFILLSLAAITGLVILIIREREKNQRRIRTALEKELEIRTSVVMQQKAELEIQNLEITDSINYAKRIQTSILPDFNKLKETFNDAFLIFRPRDIVSGDFYWFDKIDDERFVLVCADSTGHGVPGAFMSMIGSTLLQDIVSRQGISKPSQILSLLDKQIFSTLNQNIELGIANDGMDMVVCNINVKTRQVIFASAMRPVILVLGGEPYYIKGNRSSVGGESVVEKYFDDQEYYLSNGDTIYMFSDGLPDQFGGADGKKLKIARLKKLIEDVYDLPMSGQKDVITKFYDEWKGEYEQVDDILLIGVKL